MPSNVNQNKVSFTFDTDCFVLEMSADLEKEEMSINMKMKDNSYNSNQETYQEDTIILLPNNAGVIVNTNSSCVKTAKY